ncbi:MAG TPA: hypothetical protein VHR45_05205 [Thermoanaerobaculia bacterium]|nr:hypothetical protein [Thermoanaerobaculia bacterium]
MQAICLALAWGLEVRLERRAAACGLLLPLAFLSPWLWSGDLLVPTGTLDRALPFPELRHVRVTHQLLSDTVYQFLPWELEVRHALRARHLPLWSDRLDGGSSPWLNPQAGVLSPIAMLARPLPIQHFLLATLALKMLLGFEGVWLLVRRLGRSRWSALLAAAGFTLGGGLMPWGLFPHSATLAWVPWLTLGTIQLWRRPRARLVAATALITAAMLLSGHPETAVAGGLLAGVAGCGLRRKKASGSGGPSGSAEGKRNEATGGGTPSGSSIARGRGGFTPVRGRFAPLRSGVAAAGLAALLGCGLAAPQLLPFLHAVPSSQRARDMAGITMPPHQVRIADPASWFLWPWRGFLLAPTSPRVYGVPYEEPFHGPFDWADALSGYPGVVAFAGALVALLARRDRRSRPLLGFAIVALLVAAAFLPIAHLIYAVPALRVPTYLRLLPVASLALAVAGAGGTDALLFGARRRRQLALLALALGLAAAISLAADHSPWVLLLWGLLGAAALAARWRPGRAWSAGLMVAAVGLDLVPWAQRQLPHGQAELFYPRTELAEVLTRETGGGSWRVVGMDRLVYPALLPVYGLAELRPNNVLAPAAYLRILGTAFDFRPTTKNYYASFNRTDHALLSFLNVRAVVGNLYLPRPRGMAEVAAGREMLPFVVYRNPAALPRWFVPRAVDLIDRAGLDRWVAALDDPGRVALFRDEARGWTPARAAPAPEAGRERTPLEGTPALEEAGVLAARVAGGTAAGAREGGRAAGSGRAGRPGRLTLEVPGAGERLLATSLQMPEGWEARVAEGGGQSGQRGHAGQPLPKLTVDGAFLGVRVAAGVTRVTLEFAPPGLRAGLAACGASAAALVVLVWHGRRRRVAVTS